MNAGTIWAGVFFQAQNGDTDGLLTDAAHQGLHLSGILPSPGGFTAHCAAWHYLPLGSLARRRHVRLRIRKRSGIFFRLRPLFRRTGLWVGVLIFLPLLIGLQGFVWTIQFSCLTTGQAARAEIILRDSVGLSPGSYITEELLSAGEYALLQSGEFSWTSLNFQDGRLVVEAASAKPVPEISSGTLHGLRAKASGVVVSTNLVSGTLLVTPGQSVEAGQGLIGTARSERDGTLIFQPAAGSVRAQIEWTDSRQVPLVVSAPIYTGESKTSYTLLFNGIRWNLPSAPFSSNSPGTTVLRHVQPELFGFPLPVLLEETTCYLQQTGELTYPEEAALALARLYSLQALYAAYPDAEQIAQKEDFSIVENTLYYTTVYTIIADICQ